jgi:hypothetical protein
MKLTNWEIASGRPSLEDFNFRVMFAMVYFRTRTYLKFESRKFCVSRKVKQVSKLIIIFTSKSRTERNLQSGDTTMISNPETNDERQGNKFGCRN